MDWYYVRDGQQAGPVGEPEFEFLINNGAIGPTTLVWNETMTGWQTYGELSRSAAVSAMPSTPAPDQPVAGAYNTCVECGRTFSAEDMIQYGQSWVCASCKPVFFQRLKEGAPIRGTLVYGGFWIRFGAKIIDGLILWMVNMAIGAGFAALMRGPDLNPLGGMFWFLWLIQMSINMGYSTFFVGKYGATPGKMARGLVIITPDGGKVSYLRAFARLWAEGISGMILGIGYIMAGFDEEKRALHDRICGTRVVFKSSLVA